MGVTNQNPFARTSNMTKKFLPLIALAACFFSACSSSSNHALTPAQAPTGAEEHLFNAINQARAASGKASLKRAKGLDSLAASESTRLATTGNRTPNISGLKSRTDYTSTAVLVGSLKDRGPSTGASFPEYWLKGENEKEYLLEDWHRVGIGTAKTETGDLISVVLFGL